MVLLENKRGAHFVKNNEYYYAVTRIHNQEAKLLGDSSLERMRQARSYDDCLQILKEHGWETGDSIRVEQIIDAEQGKTWAFLNELESVDYILNVFRFEHDFQNIKAVIKLVYTNQPNEIGARYISPYGTLSLQMLKDAFILGNFGDMPELFLKPSAEAQKLLLQTGNMQLFEAVLDRECLAALYIASEKCNNSSIKLYLDTKADIANISTVIRGINMKKSADFFALTLLDKGSFSKQELLQLVPSGLDAIYAYIGTTKYSTAVDIIKKSLSSFQAFAESCLIDELKRFKAEIGGAGPIAAFIIAKETELKMVKFLLSSKINGFSPETVAERLRRMYA